MKKHSTGALTKEQHRAQDIIYDQGHTYDYLFIGTGMSALTCASLLAHAGKKVCMIEAHDVPGGYAHTFKMGDYSFCAQVHYIWGCGKGGKIYEFLKKIELENDITFELHDPKGYDHMIMPDGNRVKIPYGYDNLVESIEAAFPGERQNVQKFVQILEKIGRALGQIPSGKMGVMDFLHIFRCLPLLKYKNKTLQDVFEECDLRVGAQLALCGQAGDYGSPPNELSIFAYIGLFGGYNKGAYYPSKHFKYFINRVAQSITDHDGCHIFYETRAKKINVGKDGVESVETDNKTFKAKTYICNMDPQAAASMIGLEKFPESFHKPLSYKYSPSGFMVYLGLKPDIDIAKYGFGKHNTWHMEQWDMNKMWKEQLEGKFDKTWLFISTPTMHSKEPGTAPKGCDIMELVLFCDYDMFKNTQEKSYNEYGKLKMQLANRMIDLVEKYHIPNLRKHIAVKVIGSPTTNVDFCLAPRGTAYGSLMSPAQFGLGRLKEKTPWDNFFWCNASSGFAGIYGTVHTGSKLYMDLTGDRFYNPKQSP